MLTDDELDSLAESCSAIAYDNYDGRVTVTQDGDGVLTLTSFNEDGDREDQWTAKPVGDHDGSPLYLFKHADDEDGVSYGRVSTLVPRMLVGLLSY